MRFPVDNFETQWNTTAGNGFGQKVDYGFHEANDLNLNGGGNIDLGQPLYAIADGEISSVHTHSGSPTFGKHLHLKFIVDGKTYWAHYAHCNEILVTEGTKVKKGDKIATCGNSGTTFAHLHFAIKNQPTGIDGLAKTSEDLKKWENPIEFIKKHFVEDKMATITQAELDSIISARNSHWDDLQKEKDKTAKLVEDLKNTQEKLSSCLRVAESINNTDVSTSEQLLEEQHKNQPLKDEALAVRRALNIMDESDTQTLLKRIDEVKKSKVRKEPIPIHLKDKLKKCIDILFG